MQGGRTQEGLPSSPIGAAAAHLNASARVTARLHQARAFGGPSVARASPPAASTQTTRPAARRATAPVRLHEFSELPRNCLGDPADYRRTPSTNGVQRVGRRGVELGGGRINGMHRAGCPRIDGSWRHRGPGGWLRPMVCTRHWPWSVRRSRPNSSCPVAPATPEVPPPTQRHWLPGTPVHRIPGRLPRCADS